MDSYENNRVRCPMQNAINVLENDSRKDQG